MSQVRNSAVATHVGGVTALLLISGAGYLAGVRPLMAARVDAWQVERSIADRRAKVDALRADLASAKSEVELTQKQLTTANIPLLDNTLINTQLAKLGLAGEEAGLVVSETTPAPPEEGKGLVRYPIRLSGKGRYGDFTTFLTKLRSNMPDTVVLGFTMSGRSETPDEPASFSVDLLWYALREGAGSEGNSPTSNDSPKRDG